MGVELRQLVYFDAVVSCGGFSRAAKRLHVAQPAISAQVKRLETDLGVTLLERGARGTALTQAGELFLSRVRHILAELQDARTELSELSAILRGTLRIGATLVLGSLDLPTALASFRVRYPGLALSLRTGLVAELTAGLDSGSLDVVVGPARTDLPSRYVTHRLAEEHLILAVPPGHRLARANLPVELVAVQDEPFICLPPGSSLHGTLNDAATAAGFSPRIDFQADTPVGIRDLVAAGLGVALLAASAAQRPGPALGVCQLLDPPPHPPIAAITLSSPSPAAEALVTHLQQTASRTGSSE